MKKGFALIYVLLLMALIGITIFATWATGMADIRLSRKTESSTEAYQLAKSAIDDGWVKYKSAPSTEYPLGTCAFSHKFHRFYITGTPADAEIADVTTNLDTSRSQDGFYDVRICPSASTIEGVGHYKNNKITLIGQIDAANDELLIYQKGPSN